MKHARSRLIRLALSAIMVAGLVLYARTINWTETWSRITEVNRTVLIAAAVVNLLSLALKGVRWWIFLRPVGAESLWMALKATFAGAGLNNVLVANGGEAARVVFVSRAAHVTSAKVLATLALERMFELIGYIVLLALSVSIFDLPPILGRMKPVAWLALAGVVVLMIYLIRRPKLPEFPAPPKGDGWRGKAAAYIKHFGQTIGGISTGPRFVFALALSVGIWAMQVWTYALTARSANFNLSNIGTVAALLAVNLGFAMRFTPGNVGVFQALYALIAEAFGMDRDQAIAVALLIQTQQIIPVTLLGVALAPEFIFKRRTARRADDDGVNLAASRGAESDGVPLAASRVREPS